MLNAGRLLTLQKDFAGEFRWDWIVMDEGHALKNATTRLAQKVRQLPANLRMIVTGTPVQNALGELWSLYDLTCPGLLSTALRGSSDAPPV